MFVISIGSVKKKIRLATKVLLVIFLLFLLSYFINISQIASTDETIVINQEVSAEETGNGEKAKPHYPGEPIRVYQNLEDFWQDKVIGIAVE